MGSVLESLRRRGHRALHFDCGASRAGLLIPNFFYAREDYGPLGSSVDRPTTRAESVLAVAKKTQHGVRRVHGDALRSLWSPACGIEIFETRKSRRISFWLRPLAALGCICWLRPLFTLRGYRETTGNGPRSTNTARVRHPIAHRTRGELHERTGKVSKQAFDETGIRL